MGPSERIEVDEADEASRKRDGMPARTNGLYLREFDG